MDEKANLEKKVVALKQLNSSNIRGLLIVLAGHESLNGLRLRDRVESTVRYSFQQKHLY